MHRGKGKIGHYGDVSRTVRRGWDQGGNEEPTKTGRLKGGVKLFYHLTTIKD